MNDTDTINKVLTLHKQGLSTGEIADALDLAQLKVARIVKRCTYLTDILGR